MRVCVIFIALVGLFFLIACVMSCHFLLLVMMLNEVAVAIGRLLQIAVIVL